MDPMPLDVNWSTKEQGSNKFWEVTALQKMHIKPARVWHVSLPLWKGFFISIHFQMKSLPCTSLTCIACLRHACYPTAPACPFPWRASALLLNSDNANHIQRLTGLSNWKPIGFSFPQLGPLPSHVKNRLSNTFHICRLSQTVSREEVIQAHMTL